MLRYSNDNVYSDEILYQARIHPETGVGDLGEKDGVGSLRILLS
jgi:formamidopyrimidine-DNA glycosylase